MTASVIPILRRRLQKGGARAICGLFPAPRHCHGRYLYAFGLDDGIVKIGVTGRPRERFIGHVRKFGERIVWSHLFVPLSERAAMFAERNAHDLAAEIGERIQGTEFFNGLTKADAIACGRAAIARQQSYSRKAA